MIKKTVFLLVVVTFVGSMLFADMTADELVEKDAQPWVPSGEMVEGR